MTSKPQDSYYTVSKTQRRIFLRSKYRCPMKGVRNLLQPIFVNAEFRSNGKQFFRAGSGSWQYDGTN